AAKTGATAASRYVGATASGAPGSGTFVTGDWVIDQSGKVWICTAGGSPGTWGNAGSSSGVSTFNSRSGAVSPTTGDYTAAQVTNAADKSSSSTQAFTGKISSPAFIASMTGATAAARFVGGTASGAPVTGTFAVGDFVIDQTGIIWICTIAGTPGTWTSPSALRAFNKYVASDVALVFTTPTNVTSMSFAIGANEIWTFEMFVFQGGSTGTVSYGFSGPASPAGVLISVDGVQAQQVNVTPTTDYITSFTTEIESYSGQQVLRINGWINNGSNAGTVQLYGYQSGAGTQFVKAGSYMNARKVG